MPDWTTVNLFFELFSYAEFLIKMCKEIKNSNRKKNQLMEKIFSNTKKNNTEGILNESWTKWVIEMLTRNKNNKIWRE